MRRADREERTRLAGHAHNVFVKARADGFPKPDKCSRDEKAILLIVPTSYGLTTRTICQRLGKSFGHNRRTYSAWVSGILLRLEKQGLVCRLDSLKPIAWTRP